MKELSLLCIAALFVQSSQAVCRHSVVAPKGLRLDTTEEVYVDFHDCPPAVSVAAELRSLPDGVNLHGKFEQNNIQHGRNPVKISLEPRTAALEGGPDAPEYDARLSINYKFPTANWIAIPPITILLNATHGYIFMTTNRPAYRPGESVRATLAITNQDLKKETNKQRQIHILIKTPLDELVVKDSGPKVPDQNGFIDFTYTVPDNPMKGVWWAEAQIDGRTMAEKSFVVDRYELPTFDVKILPTYHFILPSQTHITGKITAVYSYGENVDGLYYLSFKLARADGSEVDFFKIPRSFGSTASITNGKRNFNIDLQHLDDILVEGETRRDLVEQKARIVITATVTGFTESVFESDYVDNILFTDSPFFIDHSKSARFYLPSTIYELKLTVRDIVSRLPLSDVTIRIAYGNGRNKEVISDENGEVYHQIDTLRNDVETIVITTHSEDFDLADQTRTEMVVRKHAAARYLMLRLHKQVIDAGEQQHVTFAIGNNSPKDIRYFVVSRGKFVHAGTKIIEAQQKGEVTTSFTVTAEMVPNSRLIAYYILNNEMTSNSAWFDVTNQCETELVIMPERDVVPPGSIANITIRGSPNMPFHLYGVDRAAYFVHDGTRVNREQLWSKMEEYDTGCSRKGGLNAVHVFEEAGFTIVNAITATRTYRRMYCEDARTRRKRNTAPVAPDSETYFVNKQKRCGESGVRSNIFGMTCEERLSRLRKNLLKEDMEEIFINECLDLFRTKCQETSDSWAPELARSAASADKKAKEVRERVRKDFAENWDFPRRSLGANGFKKITSKVKDSITTFELDAFGMSDTSPMCVAETKYIKVFRSFFIQLYLPYSVRLQEQATIRVSVFNYAKQPKQIHVYVKHADALCSRFQSDKEPIFLATLNIERQSASSTSFTILPIKIPDSKRAKIYILAQSDDQGDEDIVERELLIEEPGQPNESSGSTVLEAQEDGSEKIRELKFELPTGPVIMPSSKKCVIYAYAHPMGPNVEIDPFSETINNIGNYIRQPRGCGEQNMILVAPVIYIHKYRVAAMGDQVTAQQSRQVLASVQTGYGNELGHRSDLVQDRAFAVWHTYKPSTWLNAFVTKVFAQAQGFWPQMDMRPFCSALDWMLEMQVQDGHFVENYRVHHQEMIGQVKNDITLTAYVVISLVETSAACPDMSERIQAAADRALQYVRDRSDVQDIGAYTIAMGAYATAIADQGVPSEEARIWNRRLMELRANDGDYIFWHGTRGGAAKIETTAYALLAELTLNGINEDNDDLTRNIANWLVSQRNANGGHRSTQDTVVAMQALSTYMTVLEVSATQPPPPTNIKVKLSSLDEDVEWSNTFTLKKSDLIRPEPIEVPPTIIGGVSVAVTGVGTGSLSYRCTWRQFTDDGNCQFQLSVEVVDAPLGDDEGTKIVKVEVSKRDGDPAQMSIVDISVLSGYVPDENSIKELCTEDIVDYQADRYEITENTVKFYISSIDDEPTRLAFKIKRRALIKNGQPASVSVYDYYEPEMKCSKFYTLQGDYQIRTTGCDADGMGEDKMCKCSEGDCPICRTRHKQLHATICSKHSEHRRACGRRIDLCTEAECYPLHARTCERAYLYVVTVKEVGQDDTPGFMYFTASVDDVFRTTHEHQRPIGTTVKFLIREDCFRRCKDPRYEEIARKKNLEEIPHFIHEGRILLVYGNRLTKTGGDDLPKYVYDLSGDGGLEALVDQKKCDKLHRALRKKPAQLDAWKICIMKSILKSAHNIGCD